MIKEPEDFNKKADEIKSPKADLEGLKKMVDDSLEELEGQDISESTKEEFKNMEKETPDTSSLDVILNKIERLERHTIQSNVHMTEVMTGNASILQNVATKRNDMITNRESTNDKLNAILSIIGKYKKMNLFLMALMFYIFGGMSNEYKEQVYPLVKRGFTYYNEIKILGKD